MKIKKIPLIMIFTTFVICLPTKIFSWLQNSTYEACNIVNSGISLLLKTIAFLVAISYLVGTIKYFKTSKIGKKQKLRNNLTWLIITIIQISFLLAGAIWVTEMGMEKYWSTGERVQFSEIDGYISYGIRILALILIIAYIIIAINYTAKTKQEKIRKTENVIRGEIITFTIVAGLLILAMNW